MFIRDPLTEQGARVADGRLRVQSVQETLEADASRNGEAFTLATSQGSNRVLTFAAADDGPDERRDLFAATEPRDPHRASLVPDVSLHVRISGRGEVPVRRDDEFVRTDDRQDRIFHEV